MTQILAFLAAVRQWPRWIQIAIAVIVVWATSLGIMYHRGRTHEREVVMRVKTAADERRVAELKQAADSFRAVMVLDDKDAARLKAKNDSLTEARRPLRQVVHIADTTHLFVHDTLVAVPPEVTETLRLDASALVVKDSLLHVDDVKIARRDTLVAKQDAIIARQDTVIADLAATRPTIKRPSAMFVAKVAATGYLLLRLTEFLLRHK